MKANEEPHKLNFFQSFKCGVASLISTSISVSLMHPLEVIKVRFQSHDGQSRSQNIVPKYSGILNAFKKIIEDQGFRGLYKGLTITMINAAISSFLFFSFYQTRKKTLLLKKNPQKKNDTYEVLVAGIQSGIGVVCITQPMWVLRTRMLLNTKKNINESTNIFFTAKQIKDHHGIKGFYKGFSMNLLLSSNRALQMLAYEGSKSFYGKMKIPESLLNEKNFICGGIAKIANVFAIYPLTTLRTRIIQNQLVQANPKQAKYNNVIQVVLKTFEKQGIKGFYKGMTANLLRGIPERSIFFYSYEILKKFLLAQQMNH